MGLLGEYMQNVEKKKWSRKETEANRIQRQGRQATSKKKKKEKERRVREGMDA